MAILEYFRNYIKLAMLTIKAYIWEEQNAKLTQSGRQLSKQKRSLVQFSDDAIGFAEIYVLLRLRVQNRRTKWNFPLNFRTMRKLSELYSGIFQTQLSG